MSKRLWGSMGRPTATILLFALACVLLFARTGVADEKSRREAALRLALAVYNEQEVAESARKAALPDLKKRYESNPATRKYSDVLVRLVLEVVDAYLRDPKTRSKLIAVLAETYAERFTEPEIRELLRGKTPVSPKIAAKLPAIGRECEAKAAEIGAQAMSSPKYVRMLRDKFDALQDQGVLPREFK